ncbi:MAG: hypothetical protein JXB60_08905, partial [Candidatus Cloacimonetes bacterium]|nr:hypothetical protein [Candidatus Cloacimonadota bacterium]
MKKIYAGFTLFVLLSSTALVQADVSILNSSATGISFALEIPEPDLGEKIILGNVYTAIAGSQGKLHPGAPDLPAYGTWILVPNGAEVIITTDPGEAKVYDNIKLPPVQPPRPESGLSYNNELFIDTGIYARNQPYPGLWSEAENTKQKRGQDCTIIWFYPFQYNPQSEQLSFYPDLRVDVDFRGGNGQKAVNQGDHTIDLYSFAVNAEDILNAISTGTPPLQIRSDGYDMIIITPAEFEASAELLAEWKKRKGITTRIVTTDLLGYDAEAVDQYIADAFYNWDPAPSYLLLLGDAELVPTWYENEHVSGGDQGYTAADIYFADVNQPPDLVADLSYGRIPVDTVADADSAVHRIIAYERNPPLLPLYYSWATAACYFQDDDQNTYADRRFAKTSEDIRNFLTENSYDVERIYFTEYANDPRYWNANDYVFENDGEGGEPLPAELLKPAFPWDGNAADVINAVNRGSFLLIHRDHGFREGWGEPYFDVNHVNMLGNGNLRPVVWTINCCTGWFDNETDAAACGTGFNDECFVEHWMRHLSGGSMGLMGATRISFSGNNDRLAWGFMDALWPGFLEWCNVDYPEHYPLYKMGDVLNYGKEYMMANYTWSEYRTTTLEEFSWFGDPTLELWTSYPDYMTVMHDPEIILGSTEFMVFCDLDGARAVLLQSDQILDIAPVFNGTALLEFPQVNSLDSLELSITAHDYFPYSAFIPAVAEGPFVVCDSVYFQENGPYNDGCLQSLDFLDLDLQITNIGISPTPDDLTLQLLTDSDMVNVIIGETAAEMMAAGETQTIAAAFQIELL